MTYKEFRRVKNKERGKENLDYWLHNKHRREYLFYHKGIKNCSICGLPLEFEESTLEHIRPKSLGGTVNINNLTLSHSICNTKRGAMVLEEARENAKHMTIREVSEILNVSIRTVQSHASKMGLTKNGVKTKLSQEDITEIKKSIETSGRNDLANVREVANISTDLEMMQKMKDVLSWISKKVVVLEEENRKMLPKAEFYDQVTGSSDTVDMGEAAKVLDMGIGRNKLFELLREKKILNQRNQPYQAFIDRGYFRVIETKYSLPDGSIHANLKTVVYQKGLDYIRKIYNGSKEIK